MYFDENRVRIVSKFDVLLRNKIRIYNGIGRGEFASSDDTTTYSHLISSIIAIKAITVVVSINENKTELG